MAVDNVFKVHYHFEQGNRKAGPDYVDYVSCADNAYNTIRTVLVTNNSKSNGAGSLVIDSVQNVGISSILA